MKRYFTFATPPDPKVYAPRGMYHYMSLTGSGYICVVEEEGTETPADWTELPHLLDSSPAYFDGIQPVLGSPATSTTTTTVTSATLATPTTTVKTPAVSATIPGATVLPAPASPTVQNSAGVQPIGGIQLMHTTFQVAKQLAAINRLFHP